MNNKDLSVMINNIKLNIRVGAIIKYQDKFLIEKNKNIDFAVIPGGRIKTLENSKEALVREVKEEIGIDISNESFEIIALIENFFEFNNNKYHELYIVYKIDLKEEYNLTDNFTNLDDINAYYNLITLEELQKTKIMPNILKEITTAKEFKHYIVDNLNKFWYYKNQ